MTLPKVSDTNQLRILTIGIHRSDFLERLLSCIPFIQNFSVGILDPEINQRDEHDLIP